MANGRRLVFASSATNLITPDANSYDSDVFTYDTDSSRLGVSAEQTFGSLHGTATTRLMADPVNTATDFYNSSVADLSLPGIGLPFRLTRSYTSGDTSQGPLGFGWIHSYAPSLNVLSNSNVVLRGEDGQQLVYTRPTNGSYTSPAGARSTLAQVADGYNLTRHDQVVYHFDTSGRLAYMRDRNGNTVTLSYGGTNNVQTITDTVGRVINFSYNASGLLSQVSAPDGRTVSYSYTNGYLTSVVDVRGNATTYTYDSAGRLEDIVDQNNHRIVHNVYSYDGRIIEQTNARGDITRFSWDPATQTTTMTDPRNNKWEDAYENNVLATTTDPLGNKTSYSFDSDLNLTRVTDGRGNAVTMTYDNRANLLTRAAPPPLSFTETYTYNARNDVTSYQDGRGNTTTFAYDQAGNLTSITRPGSVTTQLGRDPAGTGLVTSTTDGRGKTTRFDYDNKGNLAKVTSPLGFVTTRGYDAGGRMTTLVDPRGNESGGNPADYTWSFTYDAANHLRSRSDPLGNLDQWSYDAAGNLTSATDANNHTVGYGYNAANQLTSVTAPNNTVTSYGYDVTGNLVSRTDAKSHTTTYAYDAGNRLSRVTSPSGQKWAYSYDANGNLTKLVDPGGDATPDPGDGTTTYGYDVLNRLTSISYSDTTPSVQYGYDANGNRTSMQDGLGTETYSHDARDRLTSLSRGGDTFSYSYNAADQVVQRTYPGGTVTDYTYDDDGRLTSAVAGGATTMYGYNAAGQLTSTTLPAAHGYVESRTYDRAGRLTEVKNSKDTNVLSKATYSRDPVGNPTSVVTTDGTTTYGYDLLDRLTNVCFAASCPSSSDPFIRYTYDAVGNRTQEERGTALPDSGTTTYSYNAADQLTSQTGPTGTKTYEYDANGNESRAGDRTFTYDLANRLASTTRDGNTATYSYDGDGKRLRSASAGETAEYLWDVNHPLPELAIERELSTGSLIRRYLYGVDRISMTTGGSTYYYHHDGLGSVTDVTSAAGVPQWSYSYEPFGATRTALRLDPLAPENPMRFAGEYLDPTGLFHLRARQYDPSLGRFTTTDPLAPSGWIPYTSSYAYVRNVPTRLTDPSGLCAYISDPSIYDYLTDVACPPSGFAQEFGYTPVVVSTPQGLRVKRPTSANGQCTGIADTSWSYDFQLACRTHDYAYDLVRFGAPGGDVGEADNFLYNDMQSDCDSRWFLQRMSCRGNANLIWSVLRGLDHLGVTSP